MLGQLPEEVLHNILVRLPLKDAAKTSILSSDWRFIMSRLPQLNFDNEMFNPEHNTEKVFFTIYQILLLHRARIHKFTLDVSGLENCIEVDHIIQSLSVKGIEDFSLLLFHKLPSHFFFFNQLKHLKLHGCAIKPPTTFQGFDKLISLEVRRVVFSADGSGQSFISKCPKLQKLIFVKSSLPVNFELRAPCLQILELISCFKTISIDCPGLVDVLICSVPAAGYFAGCIVEFLHCPGIRKLTMSYCKLKLSVSENKLMGPWTRLGSVTNLQLVGVSFIKDNDVSGVLWLILTNSLHLKTIKIVNCHFWQRSGLQSLEVSDAMYPVSLHQLLKVHISWGCDGPGLEFLKFLLAISPCLKKLYIKPFGPQYLDGLRKVIEFPRASPDAEIEFGEFPYLEFGYRRYIGNLHL